MGYATSVKFLGYIYNMIVLILNADPLYAIRAVYSSITLFKYIEASNKDIK